MGNNKKFIVWMEEVGIEDVPLVGGKNASLGEMIKTLGAKGVSVPSGFIITAEGYRHFLRETVLEGKINETLKGLDTSKLKELARVGKKIREMIVKTEFPEDLKEEIEHAYGEMEASYGKNIDTAVRSSATAEDLPGASFAGEHDTYLGIRGADNVTKAVRAAMSSLFTDRAISYRVDKGFKHSAVALSVGVQRMVRSDLGVSGVIFTVDTESGFSDVVIITGSWGLGEMIVQGEVTPDELLVWKSGISLTDKKPIIGKHLGDNARKMVYAALGEAKSTKVVQCSAIEKNSFILTDKEILKLAHWAKIIEDHYSKKNGRWSPMDIEWAKDGKSGELFIVQARPETVQAERDFSKIKEHIRQEEGNLIAKGISVGSSIATGR